MINISENTAQELITKALGKTVAVIGDVMLDRYFWGSVSRISPEAPVPVVDIESESIHLGGAANVANNLKSLGAEPLLCGLVGDDSPGRSFLVVANESGINTEGLFLDSTRPTTVKTRVLGNNQHITRLDREQRTPISETGVSHIISSIASAKNLSAIIFEDYNKGVITKQLISEIMNFADNKALPVFVDPKFDNFFEYKNVTVFKPNKKEAQQALVSTLETEEDIERGGRLLLEKLGCDNVLLTLGKQGMTLFESNGDISSVPTRALQVADVSGAGDTAIATLAAVYSAGGTVREAASIANFAAGVVCGMPGIVSITPESLISAIKRFNRENNGK